jgi:hypothetical protein
MLHRKFMERRPNFWAGGFLFDAHARKVLLHLRDDQTPFNPNLWAFFGGLNEGHEICRFNLTEATRQDLGYFVARAEVQ